MNEQFHSETVSRSQRQLCSRGDIDLYGAHTLLFCAQHPAEDHSYLHATGINPAFVAARNINIPKKKLQPKYRLFINSQKNGDWASFTVIREHLVSILLDFFTFQLQIWILMWGKDIWDEWAFSCDSIFLTKRWIAKKSNITLPYLTLRWGNLFIVEETNL